MGILAPRLKTTSLGDHIREWRPTSFDNFTRELDHIIARWEKKETEPLLRGHKDHNWLLDSIFLRNIIGLLFKPSQKEELNDDIRHSIHFHRFVTSLILLKYGTITWPSREAFEAERRDGIDPWFEWLKRIQQYPECEKYKDDSFVKGSFLIDWSLSKDIGLYFATYEGMGNKRRISTGHGALWVHDSSPKVDVICHNNKFDDILSCMNKSSFLNGEEGYPLIIHPTKQTKQQRAVSQEAVYVA